NFRISGAELREVVEKNDKQRFSFDETGERIRANQGHSTPVDLQLQPQTPPDVLYHGTAGHVVAQLLAGGVKRMSRHHVHLSASVSIAARTSRHAPGGYSARNAGPSGISTSPTGTPSAWASSTVSPRTASSRGDGR